MHNTVQTASTDIFPLKASNFIMLLFVYHFPPNNTLILYHTFNAKRMMNTMNMLLKKLMYCKKLLIILKHSNFYVHILMRTSMQKNSFSLLKNSILPS